MAKKLAYERYLWFHNRLKKRSYPKLKELVERFEISSRQASREIEFMRDFFSAPIEYSKEENGYYYSDDSFELPGMWVSEEEIISLIISKRMSSTIPDRRFRQEIDSFFSKIYTYIDMDVSALEKKISLKNIRYYRVEPAIFKTVVYSLSQGRKIMITYKSPYKNKQTHRKIDPLHMLLYMGNWHLFAFCEQKNQIRDFVLSRIIDVELLEERIEYPLNDIDIHKLTKESYGIFLEGQKKIVKLKFDREIAGLVNDQVWYPGQEAVETPNGSLLLSFPVTDYREVIRDILRFADKVEVVEPADLRNQIIEIIGKMEKIYR